MCVSGSHIGRIAHGYVTAQLQYVDTKDLSTYVDALVASREQITQDTEYVQAFHQKHFEGSNPKCEMASIRLSFVKVDSWVQI